MDASLGGFSYEGRRYLIENIKWQGHSSFVIDGHPRIQIAPWRVIQEDSPPDIILVGHDHYDHCSPADIEKIRGENTVVIGNESVGRIVAGTKVIRDWQSISLGKASIKAVPAYSVSDPRHPRRDRGLGFVISREFYDIYYVGDSNFVPEMSMLRPDILLLPIDGYGRLSVEDALRLVAMLKPRWAIPYNWGRAGEEATALDAQSFKVRASPYSEVLLLPISQ